MVPPPPPLAGNTSDILEVISEAASQPSDSDDSSLEDAEQYKEDNLSDMISANVSGRETPNVSGELGRIRATLWSDLI